MLYDYFGSMNQHIEQLISREMKILEKKEERFNNPNQKMGIVDKIIIKEHKEKISALNEFKTALADLYYENSSNYSLPTTAKEHLDNLASLLTLQEQNELRNRINLALKSINKNKKEKIINASKKVEGLLKAAGLDKANFLLYNQYNQYTGEAITFHVAIEKVTNQKLSNLNSSHQFTNSLSAPEIKLQLSDEMFLSSLEELIKSGQLEKTKENETIAENFSQIKEAYINKAKLENILLVLTNTISELRNITEVDLKEVYDYINKLENSYQKQLSQTNKFLSKFSFDKIKKQLEEKEKQKNKQQVEENKVAIYQNLAYELEKVMVETPDDYEKINEIKQAMQLNGVNSGLSNDQLQMAALEGKNKYISERMEQQAKVDAIKEKIAFEDQIKRDAMQGLREYAINELISSGAFEENFEHRNGDVYSKQMDKEKIIQRKIAELKAFADMTPEQRYLVELKKNGALPREARVEDMTYQQINDARAFYEDSAYSFIPGYKMWQEREQIKPQANNVHRDYIRYIASFEDKSLALPFSQYSKQYHNLEGMTESMVDEELLEVSRGMMK